MATFDRHPVPARTLPQVIISVTATADGRLTLSRGERLLEPDVAERWGRGCPPDVPTLATQRTESIEVGLHPTVILEGSGTFISDGEVPEPLDPSGDSIPELYTDYVPHRTPRWFAVVDGRGRVRWTHKGDEQMSLLVLVCRSTPAAYLHYLRREQIPYLVAGEDGVDLAAALAKMGDRWDVRCVVSEAGGGLNGALLRAGLVSELHVITVPALVGGLGTPTIADGPPLPPGGEPLRLRTVDVTVGSHGSVWTHYEVIRDT